MGATKRNTGLRVLERFPKIQRLERVTQSGPLCSTSTTEPQQARLHAT